MPNNNGALLFLGLLFIATIFILDGGLISPFYHDLHPYPHPYPPTLELQRSLKATESSGRNLEADKRTLALESAMYPWAESHLQPLTETPHPEKETVLFWHIPKSGGTTAKSLYECLDQTLANRAGSLPHFGHDQDKELLSFRLRNGKGPAYVNVDTTSKAGILRAQELGLVPSGMADIIFTSDPSFAIQNLYDDSHKGRVLGLFRHPVDRLVSKFYYLQIASWERTYSPQWKDISVEEFGKNRNNDNNHMVKKLAGKLMNEKVGEEDLQLAMATVKNRFVVGLLDHVEESIHRFNTVIGIDESKEETRKCMNEFFGHGVAKKNSNSHPKVEKDSAGWKILAEKNDLDIRLYDYILELYDEQKEIIESYTKSMAVQMA